MVSWDIKRRLKHSDATQLMALQWKASKLQAKRNYRSARAKTNDLNDLVVTRLKSIGKNPIQGSDLQLTSPVPRLHLCNDGPSEMEVKLVQEALLNAERERRRYLDKMQRRAVWELVESKTQVPLPVLKLLDDFVHSLKGVVSPVRRIPIELLQAIFVWGSEAPDMRTQFPKTHRPHQMLGQRATGAIYWPWTLSQVCHRWRDVCLATPTLWNYLPALELKELLLPGQKRRQQRQFSLIIERSRNSPLHVVVSGYNIHKSTHPTLEMLVKESDRWETAILELSWPAFRKYFHHIKNRLSMLRCLRIRLYDLFRLPRRAVPIMWDMFSNAPRLKHIDVQLRLFNDLFIPEFPSIPRAVDTFVNNPDLHSLSLSMPLYQHTSSPIILPHLKRFKLILQESATPNVLTSMALPSLEELVVLISCKVDNILPAIQELVRRSADTTTSYPLKKLHLQMESAPSDFLIPLVESLPNLSALEVPVNLRSEAFLHRLASTDMATAIAPSLEFCSLQARDMYHLSLLNAIHRIAQVRRCESPLHAVSSSPTAEPLAEMDITETRPFKRLKSLTLQCRNFQWLSKQQRVLEEFHLSQRRAGEAFIVTPSTLYDLVPQLSVVLKGPMIGPSQSISYDISVGDLTWVNATRILGELKKCIVKDVDVKDIYIPQVHVQLQALDEWIGNNIEKVQWQGAPAVLRELQRYIQDTLKKWQFYLDEHLPQIHWVAIAPTVLMYIPSDDPFRSSSDSINLANGHSITSCLSPFFELFRQGLSSNDL